MAGEREPVDKPELERSLSLSVGLHLNTVAPLVIGIGAVAVERRGCRGAWPPCPSWPPIAPRAALPLSAPGDEYLRYRFGW